MWSICWSREYDEEHGITNKQPRFYQGVLPLLQPVNIVGDAVIAFEDLNCKLWHHRFAHSNFSKLLDIHCHDLVYTTIIR